jgi:hypothetical protein
MEVTAYHKPNFFPPSPTPSGLSKTEVYVSCQVFITGTEIKMHEMN